MLVKFVSKQHFFRSTFLFFNIIFSVALALEPFRDDWGVTQINAKKISYSWTISNYSLNNKEFGQNLESPIFPTDQNEVPKWQLIIYPKGQKNDYKNYVAVFLKLISKGNITCHFELAHVDANGKRENYISYTQLFDSTESLGRLNFIKSDDLENEKERLLPQDRLTVVVDIIINDGISHISGKRCSTLNDVSNAEQMLTLFDNGLFSDVELHVEGRVFKVHRGILAMHSSVFLEQFKLNPNQTIFKIDNITSKLLTEVLRYVYLGKIENLEGIAIELLDASNRLGISQLKSVCEIALCKTMTPENAMKVLALAEQYDAEDLMQQASKYIAAHAIQVVDSVNNTNSLISKPHTLFEILRALIDRNKA